MPDTLLCVTIEESRQPSLKLSIIDGMTWKCRIVDDFRKPFLLEGKDMQE